MFHYPTQSEFCVVAPGRLIYMAGGTHSAGEAPTYTRSFFSAYVFSSHQFADRMAAILTEFTGHTHEVKPARDVFSNRAGVHPA
jgi:hypothetical protein